MFIGVELAVFACPRIEVKHVDVREFVSHAFRGIPVTHMVEPYGGIGLRHHTGFFAQFTQCGVFRVFFTVDQPAGSPTAYMFDPARYSRSTR